ncbi:hypothetical protein WEH80_12645 [Actinomycetes bacterium KLBMP 9759]
MTSTMKPAYRRMSLIVAAAAVALPLAAGTAWADPGAGEDRPPLTKSAEYPTIEGCREGGERGEAQGYFSYWECQQSGVIGSPWELWIDSNCRVCLPRE